MQSVPYSLLYVVLAASMYVCWLFVARMDLISFVFVQWTPAALAATHADDGNCLLRR